MKRTHALLISLVLAFAVILGSFAAIRSTQLSASATTPRVSSTEIARQNAALKRAEATLRAQLARKPPAIPALARTARPAAPQTVVYRRAPTVVHVIHRRGAEHEDGGGGGFDD
ncbi:MAG: hypothetical protein ACXVRJ_00015 [Gaiellaceae bacterium]